MRTEQTATPRATAVEQLEAIGLSNYAAQTFVALRALGSGTANDVSNASAVPRTRVYDAVDELQTAGLVNIKEASPKQFWAISGETARQTFEHKLQQRTSILEAALEEIEPMQSESQQAGVCTIEGSRHTTDRILASFETASEKIVYLTVEALLTEEIIAALAAAADRGVSVQVGGPPAVEARIEAEIPDLTIVESGWNWSDTAGRLMVVDGEKTLLSARVNAPPSAPRSETAIVAKGETNSLVTVVQTLFGCQLDSATDSSPPS